MLKFHMEGDEEGVEGACNNNVAFFNFHVMFNALVESFVMVVYRNVPLAFILGTVDSYYRSRKSSYTKA